MLPNIVQPDAGCNWGGVGGQVFGLEGKGVPGLVVRIYGLYDGQPVFANVLTGGSVMLGPGGYSYRLGDKAIFSAGNLTVQVFDLAGNAVSQQVEFNTSSFCEQNLTLVNFKAVESISDLYLPFVKLVR